jgi:hypothetical protein
VRLFAARCEGSRHEWNDRAVCSVTGGRSCEGPSKCRHDASLLLQRAENERFGDETDSGLYLHRK